MRYGLHSPQRCCGADPGEAEKGRWEIGSDAEKIEGRNALDFVRVFFWFKEFG
jgi:hypothetical protein